MRLQEDKFRNKRAQQLCKYDKIDFNMVLQELIYDRKTIQRWKQIVNQKSVIARQSQNIKLCSKNITAWNQALRRENKAASQILI